MSISTFLNAQVPTRLRGLQFLALSDTGQIGTAAVTSDVGGGGFTVWTYGASVPCSIESLTYRSGLVASRINERSTHLVNVPVGTTVDLDDRFLVTGRGTFEVTAVHHQTAEWITEFEVVQVT